MSDFIDPQGQTMIPLRCEKCGEQIGVKSPDFPMENVVARCYACAASEEAESITAAAARLDGSSE